MNSTELSHQKQSYCLRAMTVADLDTIILIEQIAQAHPWPRVHFISSLESSHQCYALTIALNDTAENEQEIVGYAITSTAADEAELLTITIAPQYQQQGLGRLLLRALYATFDTRIHTFFLEVRASNLAAITLYEGEYFNEVGLRPNYYPSAKGRREDAIIMAKSLTDNVGLEC